MWDGGYIEQADFDGNKVRFEQFPDSDTLYCLTCGWRTQRFEVIDLIAMGNACEAHACEKHLNREPKFWDGMNV